MPLLSRDNLPPTEKLVEQFRALYKDDTEARWKFERLMAARTFLLLNRDELHQTEFCHPTSPGKQTIDADLLWGLHQWLVHRGVVGAVPIPTVAEVVAIAKTASAERAKRGIE